MSKQNELSQKRLRRVERAERKALVARRIRFHGVMTTREIVLGNRYLAAHGFPFSFGAASVQLQRRVDSAEAVVFPNG